MISYLELGCQAYESGDYGKAVGYWKQAADEGDSTSMYNLGVSYETGLGVEKDYAEAAAWYGKAAEKGDIKACRRMGKFYRDGIGVTADRIKSVVWYLKAAEQGDTESWYELGRYNFEKFTGNDLGKSLVAAGPKL